MTTAKKPAAKAATAKKSTPAKKPATATKPAPAKAASKRVVPKVSPKAGMTFEAYLQGVDPSQQPLVAALAKLVRDAAPGATTSIKWSQPVFESGGPFAYMRPSKKHVTFGFWRGAELDDPKGLLEGEGDRMKHIKLVALADVPTAEITRMVKQAVALNAKQGDPTKR